jgi:hypothetical protein
MSRLESCSRPKSTARARSAARVALETLCSNSTQHPLERRLRWLVSDCPSPACPKLCALWIWLAGASIARSTHPRARPWSSIPTEREWSCLNHLRQGQFRAARGGLFGAKMTTATNSRSAEGTHVRKLSASVASSRRGGTSNSTGSLPIGKERANQGLHPTRASPGQVKAKAFSGGAWCRSWRDGQPLPVVSALRSLGRSGAASRRRISSRSGLRRLRKELMLLTLGPASRSLCS